MKKTIILAGVISSFALANLAFAQSATITTAPAASSTSAVASDYSKQKQELLDTESKQVKQLQDIIDAQAKLLQQYQTQLDAETKLAKQNQDLLDAETKRSKRIDNLLTADEALVERREKDLQSMEEAKGKK